MAYKQILNDFETQKAISFIKDKFSTELCDSLDLTRVTAPLFVKASSGLNDNLNGVERPVSFDILETGEIARLFTVWLNGREWHSTNTAFLYIRVFIPI